MQDGSWGQAFAELAQAAVAAMVRFWKQVVVQVGLTLGVFLALALPLLLVILLLWYLDATGWRPSPGFYTIGMSQASSGLAACAIRLRDTGPQGHASDGATISTLIRFGSSQYRA
jgi:hypothetical protein